MRVAGTRVHVELLCVVWKVPVCPVVRSLTRNTAGGVLQVTVYLQVYILLSKLAEFLFFLVGTPKAFPSLLSPNKTVFVTSDACLTATH